MRSENGLDGEREWLAFDLGGCPHQHWSLLSFRTRKECAAWIEEKFGWQRNRKDLQQEPHGLRLPKPMRVQVTATVTLPSKRSKLAFPNVISRTSRGETVKRIIDHNGREVR